MYIHITKSSPMIKQSLGGVLLHRLLFSSLQLPLPFQSPFVVLLGKPQVPQKLWVNLCKREHLQYSTAYQSLIRPLQTYVQVSYPLRGWKPASVTAWFLDTIPMVLLGCMNRQEPHFQVLKGYRVGLRLICGHSFRNNRHTRAPSIMREYWATFYGPRLVPSQNKVWGRALRNSLAAKMAEWTPRSCILQLIVVLDDRKMSRTSLL